MVAAMKRGSSVLELLGSPPGKPAPQAARPTSPKDAATKKARTSPESGTLPFAPKRSSEAKAPTTPEKQTGGKTSGNGKSQIDALTGKKLQRTVNEKKTKEQELQRAAELLQANAGKFAAALEAEGGEEPSDEAEDVGDETWDAERRLQVAQAAWSGREAEPVGSLSAPTFDPVAAPPPQVGGRVAFSALVPVFELAASGAGEAPTLCAVANALRQIAQHSSDEHRASELCAALRLLLAGGAHVVPHRQLTEAVNVTFGFTRAGARQLPVEELPERARAGRAKQRTLMRVPGSSVAEVAAILTDAAGEGPKLVDRLAKMLGSSPGGSEISQLVRVLQGRPALPWHVALRGLAHAMSPKRESNAAALVALEDAVCRAYSHGGGPDMRLVASLLEGSDAEALIAACPPECGVPMAFMRPEQLRDRQAAVERLRSDAAHAVHVEWLVQGDRAQVHIKGGRVEAVFVPSAVGAAVGIGAVPRADFLEEAAAVLVGNIAGDCILDVMLLRLPRKAAVGAEEAAEKASGEAQEEVGENSSPDIAEGAEPEKSTQPEKQQEKAVVERSIIVLDVIFLNGTSLVQAPLRERRARLAELVTETPRLKVVPGIELAAAELTEETLRKKLEEALGAAFLATSREEKAISRADGLVLKWLDGPESAYFAGRRASAWLALARPPVTGPEADKMLLDTLTDEERKHLPELSEFHFTVISGFRTRSVEGINDILRIQKLYNDAGVVPTWYVDNECPDEYRKLGLQVVKAGKLIPARNHALVDAEALNKICVQTSDDIGSWTFLNDAARYFSDEEANAAAKRCEKLEVSPAAAARFLTAVMRARGPGKCKLAGVYPLGNGGRAMRAKPFLHQNFILGDFFVAEVSRCRFDERMSLKEDYDFTCSHLDAHGEALRCNRLIITAKHETNAGGACAIRDAAGERERFNIGILREKWGDSIKNHPTRANQVVLRWKAPKRKAADDESPAEETVVRPAKQAKVSKQNSKPAAAAAA